MNLGLPAATNAEDTLDVLLVEDDEDTRANMCDILELDGHRVTAVGTLGDALHHPDLKHVAVMILDRQLPDGRAEDALDHLAAKAPEAPVIIVTGHADLQGVIDALRHGAAEYILKPISPEMLRTSIERIVKLKRAERRALQAERLAGIGQMATGLAHESRNALQRMQACLEMLELEVEENPEAMDLLRRIQRAQDDLQRIFSEVQGYAAPIRLEKAPLDLRHVWREAWGLLASQRSARDATLLEEIDPAASLEVRADHFRLVQVVRNLLENALAACPDPVQICIRVEETEFDDAPALLLLVGDNGPGLNDEQKRRICEPFFTTKTQGTGLGMAIAQRVIEAHGGTLQVGDSPLGGAEIALMLPRN